MKKTLLTKVMLLLCALVAGTSSTWATGTTEQVTSATATNGGSYVLAVYYDGDYYAIPGASSITSSSTYSGVKLTLNSLGKVNTTDAENITWKLIAGTTSGQFSISNGATTGTKYLIKSGTTGATNYKINTSTTAEDWAFTKQNDTYGTYEVESKKSGATKNMYLTNSSSTIGCYGSTSSTITLLEIGDAPTTYTVTFDAGAGTFVGNTAFPDEDNTVAAGTYTLPSATPAAGYTFDGWIPGNTTNPITGDYEVTDDVDFVAHYTSSTAPACTIDLNYFDFGNVSVNGTATKKFTVTTANLTSNVTLSMDGDEGFIVSPTNILQGAPPTEVTVTFTPTSAAVLTSQLKVNGSGFVNHILAEIEGTGAQSYTVIFNPGNGTCATASTTEFDGTEIDLPTATPSAACQEAGWTFAGWATASVATSATATLLPSKYTVTENITLYAVYQLTDANGASTTFNFKDLASANGWSDATAYTPVTISPITISTTSGGNNAKYYDTDNTWRMYNGGSVSITSAAGAITSVTSDPSTTFTIANGSATQSFTATTKFKSITVNYATATFASSPVAAVAKPEISGTTPFYGTTEVTITCGTAGATIQYSTDDGANWNTYTAPFNINTTTTVKAKGTKTNWTDSEVASKTFTVIAPLTVTEALTAINALDNGGTIAEQYVKGYVSTTGSLSSGKITYSISADGNATNELKIYKGKGLNNANFTAASDIALGDEVVVYGTLQKYYNGTTVTPEFIEGNYLFNKVRHPAPTFTLDPTSKSLDAYTHETVDVTLTTNTDGAITCESSDEDVATVAMKSAGVYTITAQTEGTATITIKSAVSANYAPASATVAITVTDNRTDAGISFANDAVEITWGESYTVQALTNTNNVDVVWSSTDQEVAIINGDGTGLNLNKAGTTTIKATFAGNATYKAAVASYTLTIKKANADLSYDETSFDIMLNDDNFVAPTLNNPHNQVVTYASSNTAIATVNANTGAIETLVTTAEGSATITATLEANIWYNGGTASYTINVIDPDKKGGKFNPYTVAEIIGQASATTFGNNIYVTGYIVGNYNSSAPVNPATGDTNLALADASNETAGSNTIPVELPNSGTFRTDWGPQSNKVIGYKILLKGNAQSYFSTKGIKSPSEITAVSVPATITAAEYATFSNAYATDFSATGITVYTATDNETSVTLNEVATGKVPANTPVVLYKAGADGTAINVPVIASADAIAGTNDLRVSTGTDVENMYVLAKNPTVGFYPWKGTNLSAGKIYLQGNASYSAREFIGFDFGFGGETTGINAVNGSRFTVNGSQVYNLNGQRIANPKKGLYIVNGKKVAIK